MRVAIAQAKGRLSELVREAEAGRRVILTRNGQPVAQVVAYSGKRLVGLLCGLRGGRRGKATCTGGWWWRTLGRRPRCW